MHRSIGLVNLVQGGVYLFFAAELGARWAPAGWMLWLAAGLQALAGLSLLSQRAQAKVVPVAAGVSLLVCGVILGLHVQVGAHIIERFTPVADKQSWAFLGSLGAALDGDGVLPGLPRREQLPVDEQAVLAWAQDSDASGRQRRQTQRPLRRGDLNDEARVGVVRRL